VTVEEEHTMRRNTNLAWPALAALLALAALGCGNNATRESTEPTTTAVTPAATPVSVVAVDLGRNVDAEKLVVERVDVFKPSDTIYASVRTTGTAPSTRIGVKWTYEDGQVVDQSEQTIAPQGTAATEFHIAKPDGFPAGNYKVEVFVDGNPVQSRDFKVS
jgi:hypothetical protein